MMSENSVQWNPEQIFDPEEDSILHIHCRKNVALIDEAMKERLRSVSLIFTTLVTSLYDTMMDGLNLGFETASDNFEKLLGASKKIIVNTNMILEVLMEEQRYVVVMTIAGALAAILVLVLIQTVSLWKLAKEITKKNSEVNQTMAEMQNKWRSVEDTMGSLTQELIQLQGRLQAALRNPAPGRYGSNPSEEFMETSGQFGTGQEVMLHRKSVR